MLEKRTVKEGPHQDECWHSCLTAEQQHPQMKKDAACSSDPDSEMAPKCTLCLKEAFHSCTKVSLETSGMTFPKRFFLRPLPSHPSLGKL